MRPDRLLIRAKSAALLLLITGGSASSAEPKAHLRRELRRRTLTIDDQALGSLPELHVAGGSATILTFEIPVRDHGAIITDTRGDYSGVIRTGHKAYIVPTSSVATLCPGPVSHFIPNGSRSLTGRLTD